MHTNYLLSDFFLYGNQEILDCPQIEPKLCFYSHMGSEHGSLHMDFREFDREKIVIILN